MVVYSKFCSIIPDSALGYIHKLNETMDILGE